jgi:hypothetical protein
MPGMRIGRWLTWLPEMAPANMNPNIRVNTTAPRGRRPAAVRGEGPRSVHQYPVPGVGGQRAETWGG